MGSHGVDREKDCTQIRWDVKREGRHNIAWQAAGGFMF
jgi:hypothetical protein